MDLTGQGPKDNVTVSYSYVIGPVVSRGDATLFPNNKLVGWSLRVPNDDIYGTALDGHITISYTHPYTKQVVEKTAEIQVDEDEFRPATARWRRCRCARSRPIR